MSAYIHIINCSDVLNKNLYCAILLFLAMAERIKNRSFNTLHKKIGNLQISFNKLSIP